MDRQSVRDQPCVSLLYESFHNAQGRLTLQVDVLTFARKFLLESNFETGARPFDRRPHLSRLAPPKGHRPVDELEVRAQFLFWWEVLKHIFCGNLNDEREYEKVLIARAREFTGGNNDQFESLKTEKMARIAARLFEADQQLNSHQLLRHMLVPNMISVETYFQGFPRYHSIHGRQRTDGADQFQSVMHNGIVAAHRAFRSGMGLSVFEHMYLQIAKCLDELQPGTPELCAYSQLIYLYNMNHQSRPIVSLHCRGDA